MISSSLFFVVFRFYFRRFPRIFFEIPSAFFRSFFFFFVFFWGALFRYRSIRAFIALFRYRSIRAFVALFRYRSIRALATPMCSCPARALARIRLRMRRIAMAGNTAKGVCYAYAPRYTHQEAYAQHTPPLYHIS